MLCLEPMVSSIGYTVNENWNISILVAKECFFFFCSVEMHQRIAKACRVPSFRDP